MLFREVLPHLSERTLTAFADRLLRAAKSGSNILLRKIQDIAKIKDFLLPLSQFGICTVQRVMFKHCSLVVNERSFDVAVRVAQIDGIRNVIIGIGLLLFAAVVVGSKTIDTFAEQTHVKRLVHESTIVHLRAAATQDTLIINGACATADALSCCVAISGKNEIAVVVDEEPVVADRHGEDDAAFFANLLNGGNTTLEISRGQDGEKLPEGSRGSDDGSEVLRVLHDNFPFRLGTAERRNLKEHTRQVKTEACE